MGDGDASLLDLSIHSPSVSDDDSDEGPRIEPRLVTMGVPSTLKGQIPRINRLTASLRGMPEGGAHGEFLDAPAIGKVEGDRSVSRHRAVHGLGAYFLLNIHTICT